MQSILYALGLEGMLGPGKRVPLTPCVLEELRGADRQDLPVLESQVMIEVENDRGDVMTVQRWIKHASIRRELLTVWAGAKLTDPDADSKRSEFYVGFPGSAQREAGFHSKLASFIGWDLPQVQRYDGSEAPLYMEVIFPLLYVEQKHGWAGVLANMPDYLQIRDPGARAMEFLLKLDASKRAKRREELQDEENQIKRTWASQLDAFNERLAGIGAVLEGIPTMPSLQWPMQIEPQVRVVRAEGWVTLESAIREGREELQRLDLEEIPRAEEAAGAITEQLRALDRDHAAASAAMSQLLREARIEQEQIHALDRRVAALVEDRQRNADAKRLRELGGLGPLAGSSPNCPTCHQELTDSLLEVPATVAVMTVEDNLALIDEEMGIFRAMREDSERVLAAKRQRLIALRERTNDLRREIRSAKRTLVANGMAPSEAAIAHRVRLQDRVEQLERLSESYAVLAETLEELSVRYRDVRAELKALSEVGQSAEDAAKLKSLESLLDEQLRAYRFLSLDPDSIRISPTKYVPVREGFNLGHDISASDMVRLIWAFLLGLLELARENETNHPGLLMFDEPRQQDAAEVSFRELLRRASSAGDADQQVIFATSEDPASLAGMLAGVPHTMRAFDGLVITPLPP